MIWASRKLASLGAAILLCACSGTTLRTSSLEHVRLDGRDLVVSWVWFGDDAVDVAVYEPALWQGTQNPGAPVLTKDLAKRAADKVMAWRCPFAGALPKTPDTGAGHDAFGFRYDCRGGKAQGS